MKAPSAGIVYHGTCTNGKWSGERQLEKGKAVKPNTVFITIVDPDNVFIRCALDEDKLGQLEPDMSGKAHLVAFPDKKAKVSVESISYIPGNDGKFDCKFKIDEKASLMPGLTCKVKLRVYENKNAITVPSSAVFTDNDEDYYVYVKKGDDHAKTPVTKGKSSGDKTEITSGLSEGDEILTSKP